MIDFGSVRCLNLSMIDETGPHIGVRPRGRTGLGFDFDLLPGVVIFELRGA
jgi:hypothetical protein